MKAEKIQQTVTFTQPAQPTMTDKEFNLLSTLIYQHCRIKLGIYKKLMLTSRLYKRLKHYGMINFTEYYEYLTSHNASDDEMVAMINEVSTNKTDFFREPYHFEFLQKNLLPSLVSSKSSPATINIWSAGCSSGEEAYSIAMILDDFTCNFPGISYSILCTDISTKMLEKAKLGIYKTGKVSPIPDFYQKRYLMKGSGPQQGMFRIVPELRKKIKAERLNLARTRIIPDAPMDIIFFRNVMIYFDQDTQRQIVSSMHKSLVPGGYLFIGHSETLNEISSDFKMIAPKVYQKT